MWGIHRRPVNSPHKWPVTRKMFPFDDVIMVNVLLDYFSRATKWNTALLDNLCGEAWPMACLYGEVGRPSNQMGFPRHDGLFVSGVGRLIFVHSYVIAAAQVMSTPSPLSEYSSTSQSMSLVYNWHKSRFVFFMHGCHCVEVPRETWIIETLQTKTPSSD